mmetsp:Transcript_35684/g.100465  ORF Transcript_35684/g.100465 Transcript_35684/m.100465 type:complete len:966 (+) Transcript_35684:205-3102(+)
MSDSSRVREGNAALLEKDYSRAVKLYSELLESNNTPNDFQLFSNRAAAYFHMDLMRRCVKDCQSAINISPNASMPYYLKGLAHLKMGKAKLASRTYTVAYNTVIDVQFQRLFRRLSQIPTNELESQFDDIASVFDGNFTRERQTTVISGAGGTEEAVRSSSERGDEEERKVKGVPSSPSGEKGERMESEKGITGSGGVKGRREERDLVPQEGKKTNTVSTFQPDTTPSSRSLSEAEQLQGIQHIHTHLASGGGVQDIIRSTDFLDIPSKVGLGIYMVNSGFLAEAVEYFTSILKSHGPLSEVYVGRGTAFVLSSRFQEALKDFTSAIKLDKGSAEAWKRRGQTYSALGNVAKALQDMKESIRLEGEGGGGESYHQRALLYHTMQDYESALRDFETAVRLDPNLPLSWHFVGLCRNSLGDCETAIPCYKRAVELMPKLKEGWSSLGRAYKDLGQVEEAEKNFRISLGIDANYGHGYHQRAIMFHGTGRLVEAVGDLQRAIQCEPKNIEYRHLMGVTWHSLGKYKNALKEYETILDADPTHICWYQRELLLYQNFSRRMPLAAYNLDHELPPYFKEGWCKHYLPETLLRKFKYEMQSRTDVADIPSHAPPESIRGLLQYALRLGSRMQYTSQGFLRNRKQYLYCGMAAIEIAQSFRKYFEKEELTLDGRSSSGDRNPHRPDWRDLYDISVKWRQLSEPNDPVWWVDLLTQEQFEEGFGSQTAMLSGQTKVVRYSPCLDRAFQVMKNEMVVKWGLSRKEEIDGLRTPAEALAKFGNQALEISTRCHSIASPDRYFEGTRLTVQKKLPYGVDFSIRTPGTPQRWREYAQEMEYSFENLRSVFRELREGGERDVTKILNAVLDITFYWYNFMPLSRGTAACGFTTMIGLCHLFGFEFTATVPERVQLDWEAILTPTSEAFKKANMPWILTGLKPVEPDTLTSFPVVRDHFVDTASLQSIMIPTFCLGKGS